MSLHTLSHLGEVVEGQQQVGFAASLADSSLIDSGENKFKSTNGSSNPNVLGTALDLASEEKREGMIGKKRKSTADSSSDEDSAEEEVAAL